MENVRNPEITRVSWKHILLKQEGKLYGPDHFKVVLRAQNIDPYELDMVGNQDTQKILNEIAKEEGIDGIDLLIIRAISKPYPDEHKNKIAEIVRHHIAPNDEIALDNFYFAYWVYLMAIHMRHERMTEGYMMALCNQFSEAQISWGAQHAFWHILGNGPNAEIGEKLYRDAFQRVLKVESKRSERKKRKLEN